MNNQQAMNDKISYGVFWKHDEDEEWTIFAGWLPFSDARYIYNKLATNPGCKGRRIVERVETFEIYQEEQP